MSQPTIGLVSDEQALSLAPDYVASINSHHGVDVDQAFRDNLSKVKKGALVLTYSIASKNYFVVQVIYVGKPDRFGKPVVRADYGTHTLLLSHCSFLSEPAIVVNNHESKASDLVAIYTELSPAFFRGTFKGQLDSVYRTRQEKPLKVKQFLEALERGDCAPDNRTITPNQHQKLIELGWTSETYIIA